MKKFNVNMVLSFKKKDKKISKNVTFHKERKFLFGLIKLSEGFYYKKFLLDKEENKYSVIDSVVYRNNKIVTKFINDDICYGYFESDEEYKQYCDVIEQTLVLV